MNGDDELGNEILTGNQQISRETIPGMHKIRSGVHLEIWRVEAESLQLDVNRRALNNDWEVAKGEKLHFISCLIYKKNHSQEGDCGVIGFCFFLGGRT